MPVPMAHLRRQSGRVTGSLALCAFALAAGGAMAGQVKGRIDGQSKLIPDVYLEAAKPEAHRYTWREPSPTVRQDFRVLSDNPSRELCVVAMTSANQPTHDAILVKI